MTWNYPKDQIDLVEVLCLEPDQTYYGSTLWQCMYEVDYNDRQFQRGVIPQTVSHVSRILSLIAQWRELDDLENPDNPIVIERQKAAEAMEFDSIDVDGQVAVQYRQNAEPVAGYYSTSNLKPDVVNKIWRLLDPHKYLRRYVLRAGAVPT